MTLKKLNLEYLNPKYFIFEIIANYKLFVKDNKFDFYK